MRVLRWNHTLSWGGSLIADAYAGFHITQNFAPSSIQIASTAVEGANPGEKVGKGSGQIIWLNGERSWILSLRVAADLAGDEICFPRVGSGLWTGASVGINDLLSGISICLFNDSDICSVIGR